MAQPANAKEIMRPHGRHLTNLQKAMGLENDRPLYMNCRVSLLFITQLDPTDISI